MLLFKRTPTSGNQTSNHLVKPRLKSEVDSNEFSMSTDDLTEPDLAVCGVNVLLDDLKTKAIC